ncbi:MAG: hypothetical protein ABIY71_11515 [Flavobacteriales bacterium]
MMNTRYSLLAGLCLLLCTAPVVQAQSGALDLSFNQTGYVVAPVNDLDVGQKILVQDDQKVLLIGMSFDATYTARAYVYRYMPDGTLDATFGDNGVVSYALGNEADIYSAVLTAEGKILLAGTTTDYQTYQVLLIQLNVDGSKDTSFGTDGVQVQSVSVVVESAEDIAYDVALDATGNILVCGSTYSADTVRRPFVARFSPLGVLDTSFGVDGIASIPVLTVGGSSFQGIVVQPDGKIAASGYFGNSELWYVMLVVRFNADGSLDPSLGDAGVIKYNYGSVDDEGEDLTLTPDGSILVAGVTVTQTYNYSALLVKFTPSGELDTTFGNAGTVKEDIGTFDFASSVEVMDDGRIVMGGSSGAAPPGAFDLAVWKYHADGTPDMTFGTNGVAQHVIPDYSTMIYGMGIQAYGKIVIGGQARTTTNQNYFFVGRLQNDLGTGIAELNGPEGALVYPNPATENSTVTMQLPGTILACARISLYAADGRLVFASQVDGLQRDAQQISFQLPTDLAPGIYQLAFLQEDTRHTASLIITQ